jgi:hypothetical protein
VRRLASLTKIMQTELTAASRHEHLVLFDPGAIPIGTPVDPDLLAQDPKLLSASAMMDLAARGQALILHIPTEDCEARIQLFVDEAPSERIRSRGTVVLANAALDVPTGVLKADGLEFLSRPGEHRAESQAEQTVVPAGRYSVEVLNLLPWKLRHRIADGRCGLGWKEKAVHRLVFAYTWLGVLLLPGNLLVAPMVLVPFWRSRDWRGGLAAAAIILAINVVIVGGFWLLQAAQKRFPILFRVADADADFERENPDVVIVLRVGASDPAARPPALARLALEG